MTLKSFVSIVILIAITKPSYSQIDGEFWWLNDKITGIHAVNPGAPKYEDISHFETDETDVILFEDDSKTEPETSKIDFSNIKPDSINKKVNSNSDILNWSYVTEKNNKTNVNLMELNLTKDINELSNKAGSVNATLNFNKTKQNSDDIKLELNKGKLIAQDFTPKTNKQNLKDALTFGVVRNSIKDRIFWPREAKVLDSDKNARSEKLKMAENSCVCLEKDLCRKIGGKKDVNGSGAKECKDPNMCCISIPTERQSRIIFPDELPKRDQKPKDRIRFTRSLHNGNIRTIKASLTPSIIGAIHQNEKSKRAPSFNGVRKIVSNDEDSDPYWNIKNVFSVANFSRFRNTKVVSGYGSTDYDEEYAQELPRAGLQDFRINETPRPLEVSWSDFNRNVGQNHVYYGDGYQSPVLDPRYDHVTISTSLSIKPKPKPTKVPVSEETEEIVDEETDFINTYQSSPDFQIFQDFKLPLYRRNKSRTTTEKTVHYDDSLESVAIFPIKTPSVDGADRYEDKKQAYPKCGQVIIGEDVSSYGEESRPGGSVRFASRPWLALVTRVSSSERTRTLCAATLLHPLAALTAASCVHRAREGEVTLRAGDWDLSSDSEPLDPQYRRVSIYTHESFRAGELGNDLAVLYWDSPLELCASVQPACLAEPLDGDTCVFVGWGGADTVFHRRPTEQRAVLLSASACAAHVARATRSPRAPRGAFCASVLSPGCASGAGGSLLCRRGRRWSAAGVATWRGSCDPSSPVVLNTAREWTLRALQHLHII